MRGFTLIELIIYIGIVVAILLVAVNFAWEIIYGNVKAQSWREVQQNSRFAMEKISQALRNGQDPSIFTVSNYVLYQNGIPLTTDRVKVTTFQITSITNGYKINLVIEHINPNNQSQYAASLATETTISLR